MTTTHARCSRCRLTLPLDSYRRDGARKNGHSHYCKTCVREYRRTHRPDLHAARLAKMKAADKRFPERDRARKVTMKAVKSGRLLRMPCARCGATEVHAHHADYFKPLEVIWLCPSCHGKLHYAERMKKRAAHHLEVEVAMVG